MGSEIVGKERMYSMLSQMMTIESAMGNRTMGEHESDFGIGFPLVFVWNRRKTRRENVSSVSSVVYRLFPRFFSDDSFR